MPSSGGDPAADSDWVTLAEVSRRLGMSVSWVKRQATAGNLVVTQRCRRPGVQWSSVQSFVDRSRVTHRVNDALLRIGDPLVAPRGIDLIDRLINEGGWTEAQICKTLRVDPGSIASWRISGVPNHRLYRLRQLETGRRSSKPER